MRLIDADYLKNLPFERMIHTDFGDTAVSIEEIDNAPTIEITEEQAIDKLHDTGWLPRHDKEMTERPTVTDLWRATIEELKKRIKEQPKGEWIKVTRRISDSETSTHWECSKCHNPDYRWGKAEFCSFCGADMRVKDELNNELNNELNELEGEENVKPCSSCVHFNNGNRKSYPCGSCFINSHNMWEAENDDT